MNIKPMLVRFESAMGRDGLIEQMVLLPEKKKSSSKASESAKSLTLIVAYNGSPKSHAALDITLLMAHQTRLATSKEVTVQVVYVLDETQKSEPPDDLVSCSIDWKLLEFSSKSTLKSATCVVAKPKLNALATRLQMKLIESSPIKSTACQNNGFEQAERVLWQARCLVEEWGGSFVAHLRFGSVATQLREVVESEAADLLLLGCKSVNHPIVQQLGKNFPCPVLGIPHCTDDGLPSGHN